MVIFLFLTLGSISILLILSNIFYKRLLYFKLEKQKLLYEKEIAFGNLSAQVAHNIRSPLAALETVLNKANQLPHEYRIMVSHAINRIRDIANNLLEKYKVKDKPILYNESLLTESKNLPNPYLISSLVERVVNKKTGHNPEKFSHIPWLKVIDKTPPWIEKQS